MRWTLLLASVLTGTAIHPPGLAQSISFATLAGLELTVVDLRPDDGLAAGFTLVPGLDRSYAGVLLNGEAGEMEWWRRPGWLSPFQQERSAPGSSGVASLSGSTFTASGRADGREGATYSAFSISMLGTPFGPPAFGLVLAPWTRVDVQAHYELRAQNDAGCVGDRCDSAWAYAHLTAYGRNPLPFGQGYFIRANDDAALDLRQKDVQGALTETGTLTISLLNDSGEEQQDILQAGVNVQGGCCHPPLPIPEPGTTTMMLLGLGALVARGRSWTSRRGLTCS